MQTVWVCVCVCVWRGVSQGSREPALLLETFAWEVVSLSWLSRLKACASKSK